MSETIIRPDSSSNAIPVVASAPVNTVKHHATATAKGIVISESGGAAKRSWFNTKLLVALFVLAFGGIGSYFIFASHADSFSINGRIYYNNGFSIRPNGSSKSQNSSIQSLMGFDWSFSPDGNKIASVVNVPPADGSTTNPTNKLVVADEDGSNQKVVVADYLAFDNGGQVAWSSDGTWLAFGIGTASTQYGKTYPVKIGLIHPDGSGYHTIPGLSIDVYKGFWGVSWKPGSDVLIYLQSDKLCSIKTDGSNQNCVGLPSRVDKYATYGDPVVSPDGTKVLMSGYYTIATGDEQWTDVYIANIDGSHVQQLTHMPATDATTPRASADGARWSPDGGLVAYGVGSSNPAVESGLYIMNADGSNQHKIDDAQGYGISWQHKQPTDPVATNYFDGNVYVNGNTVLTPDGQATGFLPSTGSPNEPYDGISWTGKQYSSIYRQAGQPNVLKVSGFNDSSSAQPTVYPIAGTTGDSDINYSAWSRSPAADGSGQKIAFRSGSSVSTAQLGSVDLTTGQTTMYTTADGRGLANPALYGSYSSVMGVDWSTDNSQLYFAVSDIFGQSNSTANNTLTLCDYTIATKVVSCDGAHQIKLGQRTSGVSSSDMSKVVWSPDDTRIAYAYKGTVYVANRDGSAPTQVSTYTTGTASFDRTVAWMPDGQSVLYSAYGTGKPVVYKVTIASKATSLFTTINGTNYGARLYTRPIPKTPADTAAPNISNLQVHTDGNGSPSSHSSWYVGVHANDNVGIAKVEVYDNDTLVASAAGSSNSQDFGDFAINPEQMTYGVNKISVKAYDYFGNAVTAVSSQVIDRGYLYNSLTPTRIVDTRVNSGKPLAGHTIPQGGILNVPVAGTGGVPPVGAKAVVLSVTEQTTAAAGYMQVYPTGAARSVYPLVAFQKGKTVNNQMTVSLGTGGQISLYNTTVNTNAIIDVVGYYATTGDTYTPVAPTRIADTRPNSGKPLASHTIAANTSLNVPISGLASVPATATNAVVEITNTNTKGNGYLTAYATDTARPGTASFIYNPSEATRQVTVKLGTAGAMTLYNGGSQTDVVVDVVGYYSADTAGSSFVPISPVRIADTRNNSNKSYAGHHLTAGSTLAIDPGLEYSSGGIPSSAKAITTNTVLTGATLQTYLTSFAHATTRPGVATQFTQPGLIVANEGTYGLNSNEFDTYNASGTTDLIVDAIGYFY